MEKWNLEMEFDLLRGTIIVQGIYNFDYFH